MPKEIDSQIRSFIERDHVSRDGADDDDVDDDDDDYNDRTWTVMNALLVAIQNALVQQFIRNASTYLAVCCTP